MSEIIHPGAGLLYMKVGTHAREGLEEIIARKRKEIDDSLQRLTKSIDKLSGL